MILTQLVPGVPDITQTIAKRLIQEYGTIDNLLENVDQISDANIRKLCVFFFLFTKKNERDPILICVFRIQKYTQRITLSFQLVQLRDNVDVPPLETLKKQPINPQEV
jgi:5'-3' exonuclease